VKVFFIRDKFLKSGEGRRYACQNKLAANFSKFIKIKSRNILTLITSPSFVFFTKRRIVN
jgi:hypothetical protein